MAFLIRNQAICRAYQTEDVSIRDLAARHGITFQRVSKILQDHGVERLPPGNHLASRATRILKGRV